MPADETRSKTESQSFLRSFLEDEGAIWTSPFRLKKKEIIIWTGAAVLTGVLIANDEAIYRNFKDFQADHSWVNSLSRNITILGDGTLNLGISGLFWVGGLIFNDDRAKETARLSFMSLLHASVVVQVLKHFTGRQRPEYGEGKDFWHGPSGMIKRYTEDRFAPYDAFPSGHTITAWSVATVVAEMYKHTVYVPVLCYTLATLAGLSRVTEDQHWLSDVFVGALLGYAISRYVVKKRGRNIAITPILGNNRSGVSISLVF